jgi:hypothetical protein
VAVPVTDGGARHRNHGVFASTFERRLWLWASAAIVAIYATLAVPLDVAAALVADGGASNLFLVGFVLAVIAVVGPWFRRRPSVREVWVAVVVMAVGLAVLSRLLTSAERTHLFEYGLVAILAYHALSERRRCGRRVTSPALLAIAITAAFGLLDEALQSLLPNRFFDWFDVGTNALAALLAVGAVLVLRWARLGGAGRADG